MTPFLLHVLQTAGRGSERRRGGNRTYAGSETLRDRSERRAKKILSAALDLFEMSEEDLVRTVRGDLKRTAVATRLLEETTMSQQWIAQRLGMLSAPNVCQQIRRFRAMPEKELPAERRRWRRLRNF